MAKIIPSLSSIRNMTTGERRLGQRLESLLEDDYTVWYDLPVGRQRGYPDFIVLHPGRGLSLFGSERLETADHRARNRSVHPANSERLVSRKQSTGGSSRPRLRGTYSGGTPFWLAHARLHTMFWLAHARRGRMDDRRNCSLLRDSAPGHPDTTKLGEPETRKPGNQKHCNFGREWPLSPR